MQYEETMETWWISGHEYQSYVSEYIGFMFILSLALDARQCFDWLPVSNEEIYLMFSLWLGDNMHQENSHALMYVY